MKNRNFMIGLVFFLFLLSLLFSFFIPGVKEGIRNEGSHIGHNGGGSHHSGTHLGGADRHRYDGGRHGGRKANYYGGSGGAVSINPIFLDSGSYVDEYIDEYGNLYIIQYFRSLWPWY